MPNQYVLWGSAGHAIVLADLIRLKGDRVVSVFDNNPNAEPVLSGIPLFIGKVEFENWLSRVTSDDNQKLDGAVAIAGAKGRDRLAMQAFLAGHGIRFAALVHPATTLGSDVEIGAGTQILAGANVASRVSLGRACILNHACSVDHESVLGDGVHVAPGAIICGCVSIGDGAMIGAGATVLPRCRIGSDAIIGAGSVVTRDVASGAVVCGNPAKPLNPTRN